MLQKKNKKKIRSPVDVRCFGFPHYDTPLIYLNMHPTCFHALLLDPHPSWGGQPLLLADRSCAAIGLNNLNFCK